MQSKLGEIYFGIDASLWEPDEMQSKPDIRQQMRPKVDIDRIRRR